MELHKISSNTSELVTAFAESRIGGRPENQDSYGWVDTKLGYLVTVCDGMGGGPGGKTASTIAVGEITSSLASEDETADAATAIINAVKRANTAIIDAGNERPELRGMGSTATVLLLSANSAFVAHVGDSRVYQLRGKKKAFRTFDHSMVFEMVSQGVITEEQARLSAQSNIITRALGIHPDVEVDVVELPYLKGDRFMLCTDGIHGSMNEKELVEMASTRKTKLGVTVDNLATCVDNIGRNAGGGHDNLTLAIVETKTNSKLKPKMSSKAKATIVSLLVLFAVSLMFNVYQCVNSGKSETMALNDTIETLRHKDTLNVEKIKQMENAMEQIRKAIENTANNNKSHKTIPQ